MAKIRPAGKKKKTASRPPGTIPCLILLVMGFLLLALLFYAVVKTGVPS